MLIIFFEETCRIDCIQFVSILFVSVCSIANCLLFNLHIEMCAYC